MAEASYPLLRLFFGETEAEILVTRNAARALIAGGKTIMKVSGGGRESEKAFPMPPMQVVFECNAALKHANPARYGRRGRKSHGDFSRSSLRCS